MLMWIIIGCVELELVRANAAPLASSAPEQCRAEVSERWCIHVYKGRTLEGKCRQLRRLFSCKQPTNGIASRARLSINCDDTSL